MYEDKLCEKNRRLACKF